MHKTVMPWSKNKEALLKRNEGVLFAAMLNWKQVSLSGDTLKLGEEIRAKDVDCKVISIKEIVEAELCLVIQSCLTLCNPMVCSPPSSSVHWILQARILQWVAIPSSKGSSQPRIEPRSPALQVDSLPSEPPGNPKNSGVGSLSLLQGIFLTQELNRGLLHCGWIPYQLSY